jgi:PAS domain S-box-containing protein
LAKNKATPATTPAAVPAAAAPARIADRLESLEKLETELRVYQAELEMQNEMLRETESTLEESRELYRQLFNLAPLSYFVIDSNHTISLVNKAGAALLAGTPAKLINERFTSFIAPEFQDNFHHYMTGLSSKSFQKSTDVALTKLDGNSIYVEILAARTGVAGENFLLAVQDISERRHSYLKMESQHSELSSLSRRLLWAQEDERRRISMTLHDEIGQQLTVLKLMIDSGIVRKGELVKDGVKNASEQALHVIALVRGLSSNLYPAMLKLLGLDLTLRALYDRLKSQTGLQVDFRFEIDDKQLDQDTKLYIYRIIQEALTNVMRYSGVHQAFVTVRDAGDRLSLNIRDEGRGFDLVALNSGQSNGLNSMRERVLALEGSFRIESQVGSGTNIEIELPKTAVAVTTKCPDLPNPE